ncbi:serine-rich adhesin for platelets-like [Pangasianodon hypophthalmus]|uniref:serine-rich adhesin for platelets-like n=1 Tax=Pangasianodon hypophthalmus TaxID=310915 RepID=UPI002307580F|nr:serine-rich adhesin for platelets-like [Pangasianodon hypophthalmus]
MEVTITTESTTQATTTTESTTEVSTTAESTGLTTTLAPSITTESTTTEESQSTILITVPQTTTKLMETTSIPQSTPQASITIEQTTEQSAASITIWGSSTTPEAPTTTPTTEITTITESTTQATTTTESATAASTTAFSTTVESTGLTTIIAPNTTEETPSTTPTTVPPTTSLIMEVTTTSESTEQSTTAETPELTTILAPSTTEAPMTTEETPSTTPTIVLQTPTKTMEVTTTTESTSQATMNMEQAMAQTAASITIWGSSTTPEASTTTEGTPTIIKTTEVTTITETTTRATPTESTTAASTTTESTGLTTIIAPNTTEETPSTTPTTVPPTTSLIMDVTTSSESTEESTTAESTGLTTTLALRTIEAPMTTEETASTTPTTVPPTPTKTMEVTTTTESTTQATTTTESTTEVSTTAESTGLTTTLAPSITTESTTTEESQSTILITVPQTTTKLMETISIPQSTSQATITMEQTTAQLAASITILGSGTTPEASTTTEGPLTTIPTTVPTAEVTTEPTTPATTTESTTAASTTAFSTTTKVTGLTTIIAPNTTEEIPSTTPTTVPQTITKTMEVTTSIESIKQATATTESTTAESTTTLAPSTKNEASTSIEETPSTTPTTLPPTATLKMEVTTTTESTMEVTTTTEPTTAESTTESTILTTIIAPTTTTKIQTTKEKTPSTTPTTVPPSVTLTTEVTTSAESTAQTATSTGQLTSKTEFTSESTVTTTTPTPSTVLEEQTVKETSTIPPSFVTPTTTPNIEQASTIESTKSTETTTGLIKAESTGLVGNLPATSITTEETPSTTPATLPPTTTLTMEVTTTIKSTTQATTTEEPTAESTTLLTAIAPSTTSESPTTTEQPPSTTPTTVPHTTTQTMEATTITEFTTQAITPIELTPNITKVPTTTEKNPSTTSKTAPPTKTLSAEVTTTTESTTQTATTAEQSSLVAPTIPTTEPSSTTESTKQAIPTTEQPSSETTAPTPTAAPGTEAEEQTTTKETPTTIVTAIFTTQPTPTTHPTDSTVSITISTPTTTMEARTTTEKTPANIPTNVTLITTPTTKVTTATKFTTQSTTTTEQTRVTALFPGTNTEEPTTTKEAHRTYTTVPPAIMTPRTEVATTTEPATPVATTTEPTTAVPSASTTSIAPSSTNEPPTTQSSTTPMIKLITISASTLEPTSTTETTTTASTTSSFSLPPRTTTGAPTTKPGTLTTTFTTVPSLTTAKTTVSPNPSTLIETLATTPTALSPFTISNTENPSSSESTTQIAIITGATKAKTTASTNNPAPNTRTESPTTTEETPSTPTTVPLTTIKSTTVTMGAVSTTQHIATTETTPATTLGPNTTSEAPTTADDTLITTSAYITQTTLATKTELTIAISSSAQPIELSTLYSNVSQTSVTPSISSETANAEPPFLPFTVGQGNRNLTTNTTFVTLSTAAFSSTTLVPATPVSILSITPISPASTTPKEDLTTATGSKQQPSTLTRNANTSASPSSQITRTITEEITLTNSPKIEINTTEANATEDTAISATTVTTLTISAISTNTTTAESTIYTSSPNLATCTVPLSIIAGTGVVQTRLMFNSSAPIPSETLVLSAITALLSSELTNISGSVKVRNFTYEKISNTSYAVIFIFSLSNITEVQKSINDALNILLNEPGRDQFELKCLNMTSSGKQIEGYMEYIFQDGDTNTLINFLSELQKQSVSSMTVAPSIARDLIWTSAASPIVISGSAVVQTRLLFNSSSAVPSESLVFSVITSLLSSRYSNLSDSVNVLNFTYENISDTSYAVIFTINISNLSMPENPERRNNTYNQVENSINNALNTLLNAPGAEPFAPNSSNFTCSGKQIEGDIEYSFQDGDTNIPITFLSELQKQSGYYTSVPPSTARVPLLSSAATPIIQSGSAVVQTRLLFNSSSAVPSESLVLSVITSLLSSRYSNLSDSVNVLNFTYENISDTSYAVIFTINISNLSMPENPERRNNTYNQVENSINNALNTLLNAPGAEPFAPNSSNFTCSGKQIEGDIEYSFQDGDTNIPITFLSELQKQSGYYTSVPPSTARVPLLSSAATPIIQSGSAVVQTRLLFNSSSAVPSESLVLSVITSLLSSRYSNLSDSVNVLNFTYENISDTSYAVIFTINISNLSMPENPERRNNTYNQVENSINNAVSVHVECTLCWLCSGKQIEGDIEYSFQDGDTNIPITFLSELQKQSACRLLYISSSINCKSSTVVFCSYSDNTVRSFHACLVNGEFVHRSELRLRKKIILFCVFRSGSAVVQTRLLFNSSSAVPSESLVLSVITSLLSSRYSNLSDSVNVLNFTYENISDTSYAVIFTINISNLSMPENPERRNNTYNQVENSINNAVSVHVECTLCWLCSGKQIEGDIEYSFQDGDTNIPITFLSELQKQSACRLLYISSSINCKSSTVVFCSYSDNTVRSFHACLVNGEFVHRSELRLRKKIILFCVFRSGSAVVQTRLLFNSSSAVPSESLVLSVITSLLSSRYSNLSDSVNVLNFTYENISDTSYAVIFTINISNLSMPENPERRNNTYNQVENSINNAVSVHVECTLCWLSGSAVVQTRLLFNSSSAVPSESLVLSVITSLLSSRYSNLSDSVNVLNFTYENISDTSYAVIFTINISNLSMPENPERRNNTYNQVENSINNALNTLLNAPGAEPFAPNSSNFTCSGKQIEGDIEYSFQDGDTNIPITFLSELQKQSACRLLYISSSINCKSSTVVFCSYSDNTVRSFHACLVNGEFVHRSELRLRKKIILFCVFRSGSAVVQTRLLFNSSSAVPSESLVLSVITSLLSSRYSNLSDSVNVLNFTYENISDTSYAVIFTINISNLSMPENPERRNNTYNQVENSINNALNTLLNAPGAEPFAPNSSNFTCSGKQIEGDIEYSFQDGDTNIPITFLSELQKQSACRLLYISSSINCKSSTVVFCSYSDNTVRSFHACLVNGEFVHRSELRLRKKIILFCVFRSGSAVVQTRLLFNSSSAVPSESLVLSVITSLLSSRYSNLSDSVNVLNFTYENISDTSYAVIFTINISNLSMPENPERRNNTYNQVENSINNAVSVHVECTLCWLCSGKQIEGDIEYSFQDGDTNIPITFLSELQKQSGYYTSVPPSTARVPLLSSAATPIIQSGSAVVQTRLLFNSSSAVPSESLVLSVITSLLSSRYSNLSDSVNVLNFTYENISDTSYAVIFTINISNLSMPENPERRNNTYNQVENSINNALNTLLNAPGAEPFAPNSSNFTCSGKQIEGDIEYSFQDGDTNIPITFLSELQKQSGYYTSVPPSTARVPLLSSAATPIIQSGSAVVQTRLLFNSSSAVPSESLVLSVITSLLSSRYSNLSDSVNVLNFTYENISDTSYAVIFTINISNLSMPENPERRNNTYNQVENSINNAVSVHVECTLCWLLLYISSSINCKSSTVVFCSYSDNTVRSFHACLVNGEFVHRSELRLRKKIILFCVFRSGSAVVQTRLLFNSSSAVPSESLVLSVITSLLSSRYSNLSDSVNVLNFTYENISDTSYAVIFTINISNLSMPENPERRNNTYNQVENSINNALNTLLNAPGAEPFAPNSSNFTLLYISSSINCKSSTVVFCSYSDNTVRSFHACLVNGEFVHRSELRLRKKIILFCVFRSGSAVVQTRLLFNSSSAVPSESLVLSVITSLLSSRYSNLSDSVNVLNFTYENISDTSYAVIFTINISNLSMPENPERRNNTYNQVENSINNALNTLLNAPGAEPFAPNSSNFTCSGKQIEGDIEYSFQDGDTNIPITFLSELQKQSACRLLYISSSINCKSSTVVFCSYSDNTVRSFHACLVNGEFVHRSELRLRKKIILFCVFRSGSAVVQTRLLFNSSSAVPSESLVLSVITSLLSSRYSNLSDSVNVLNFTYENISDTSYAVIFTINISNLSMPENPERRNNTYNQVENSINNALNTLLNAPGAEPFAPNSSNFT